MKKIILGTVASIMALSFTACSEKIPDPVKVRWSNSSAISINQNLVFTRDYQVPKDPYLKTQNFTYQIVAQKEGNDLFRNEQITETFLVAHNASEIIIIGREDLIKEYARYFTINGVRANIKEQIVEPVEQDLNKVNILFFNQVNKKTKDEL